MISTTSSLTSMKLHGTKPQKPQRCTSPFVSLLSNFNTSMNLCQISLLIATLKPLNDHNQWPVTHAYKSKSST